MLEREREREREREAQNEIDIEHCFVVWKNFEQKKRKIFKSKLENERERERESKEFTRILENQFACSGVVFCSLGTRTYKNTNQRSFS